MNAVNKLVEELTKAAQKSEKTYSYDAAATVLRVENGTAYVKLGEAQETPVEMNISAKEGDRVNVRVSGGRAYIIGNATEPPTGDSVANQAIRQANEAHVKAGTAIGAADEASTKADEAQDEASAANDTANSANKTAKSILIYDHIYTLSTDEQTGHLIATFTAFLYQGGVDVKHKYDETQFTWYMKTEDGEEPIPIAAHNNENWGYTCIVDTTTCGYGAEVIGYFSDTTDSPLLNVNDDSLTNINNTPLTGRTESGDSVRVRDLSVSTSIYDIEKLLIVGAQDEHLVTVATLSDAVDKHYTYTQATPSDTWTITHNLRKRPSITVVDSAGSEVIGDCDYVDENTVVLTFTGGFAGNAYLN